jgi:hypothetical protein
LKSGPNDYYKDSFHKYGKPQLQWSLYKLSQLYNNKHPKNCNLNDVGIEKSSKLGMLLLL